MKKSIAAVVGIALIGGLVWYGSTQHGATTSSTADAEPANPYQLEAQDVVLRQMDASGELQYEVEAEHIMMLPAEGGVLAAGLTLYHDPPGTARGSPQRWTLKASEGRLPNEGRVVHLTGDVRAEGQPAGFRSPIRLTTSALDFDLDRQVVTANDEVDFFSGSYSGSGRDLQVDMEAGVMTLGPGHAKIIL